MSAIPRSHALSEAVARPLRQVRNRRWRLTAGTGLMQWLTVCLTVWLAGALIAGTVTNLPAAARMAIGVVAWGAAIVGLVLFLRPALARFTLTGVARQVESDLNDNRELLSSAVELSGEQDARYSGSAELVSHLTRQAEAAARAVKPTSVVPYKKLGQWGMILFPVLLCWAVLLPAMPTPILRGLRILLTPWKIQLPPGLVPVTVTPGDATIAEGESVEITAAIAPRFRNRPNVTSASLEIKPTAAPTQLQMIDMSRTGPRAFKQAMEHLTAGFSYRIVTPDGSSDWNTISVLPRPALMGIDVNYVYPTYTKLPAKTDPNKDGSVDALVDTDATLILHSTQPLAEKSQVIVSEKSADERGIPLTSVGNNDYTATFTVTKATQYRVELISAAGLAGRDDLIHPITARPDEPPTIAITAPAAKIKAPPDDTVPVLFKAADDFGLTKLEAIVQINGQPPETVDIPFSPTGAKATGRWNLSIPDQLARKNLKTADRIEYQLKVIDNRDPNPQVGYSSKQMIEIDHSSKTSPASRNDAEQAKNIYRAIEAAIHELGDEKDKLDPLIKTGQGRVFTASMKKVGSQVKDATVQTGTDLSTIATENLDGSFADIAGPAKNIADGPIRAAGDDLAHAVLDVDQIDARQKGLATAVEKIATSKKALEALLVQLKFEMDHKEVTRALKDMAEQEKQIAKDLAEKPKKNERQEDMRQQEALRQRLEELLKQSKDLNTIAARQAAERNEQLVQKIEQLERQQKPLEGLAEKQDAIKQAEQPLKDLVDQQKALNKEIQDFVKAEQPELKDANAQPPQDQKLNNIVEALKQPNRAQEANQQQREAANDLKTAAKQLAKAAKANDAAPARREQQDAHDIQHAKADEKEAADIGKQIDAAKDADPILAQEQIKQKEQALAQKLEQQAGDMKNRDAVQKNAVEAAQKEIAQAKQDAQNGDTEKADKELADAAAKLEAAANADNEAAQAEQKELAADAKQADALAQKQKDLADQTSKAVEKLAKAKQDQGDPNQLENAEKQAAAQAEQAANAADQVKQQDQQQGEGEMAKRAAEVQKDLKEAEKHEQAAAQAAHDGQADKAAAEQKAAEQALAQAEQAARGNPDQGDTAQGGKGETPDAKGDPTTGEKGNPPSGKGESAEQLVKDAADAAQEARQAEQEATNGKPAAAAQAAKALGRAAKALDAVAQKQAAEMAANNPAAETPPGDPSQDQADAHQPANAPGQESAKADKPSSTSGQNTDPKGIDITGVARVDGRPASVREIGISASDWAKLPPLAQQQLLNAAQKNGPPGYQEKIKNYFVKIARIQAEEK